MPILPEQLDEAGRLDDSVLAALPCLGESAAPNNQHDKWASHGLIKPKAKMRLFLAYGMGGFSASLHDWFRKAPDWLEVRPLELPGHGWRKAEPLTFAPGSSTDPVKFWQPPAFIDSPFAEKREYLQYLQLPPVEREAMLRRYLALKKPPTSDGPSSASSSASAAPAEALTDAPPEVSACLRLRFLKATTASISLEFVLPDEHPPVACFELQWRLLPNEGGAPPTDWKTASAALAGPTATKGMLKAGLTYAFRARAQLARAEAALAAATTEPEAPQWTPWTPSTEPLHTLERKGIDPSPATSPVPPRRLEGEGGGGGGECGGGPRGGLPALDTPSAQAALMVAYSAARDALVSSLVDSISALTGAPYALYGFSNGAMLVYQMAVELQRRGLPPPRVVLCACRGAPHIVRLKHSELASVVTMSDAATIEWAERAGVLAPASERGLKLNPRFAPTARSDIPLGILEVGTRPCEPQAGCGALESSASDDAAPIYADAPPKLQARLVALLGSADEMWPSAFGSRWADVAGEGGFQEVCLPDVPHHQLQSHKIMRDAVLRELGRGLAAEPQPAPVAAPVVA